MHRAARKCNTSRTHLANKEEHMYLATRTASKRLALLNVLLMVVGTVLIATPSFGQAAEPSIAFLNPSGFASTGERGILVSDLKPDAGPLCCDAAKQGYH